jgi:hypothetical protein
MNKSQIELDPRKMNQYLAAGRYARSEMFYQVYSSIKKNIVTMFLNRAGVYVHHTDSEVRC